MRTPSPPWCRLDRSHLWPTGSSLGRPPLITARDFSSCLSDSTSRWTPCPPESASGGFRFTLAVSGFRLRARLGFSIPSTSPASEAINPAFGYDTPHSSVGGTLTLLNDALLSTHHGSIGDSWPMAFSGCPRGPRVGCETKCPRHICLTSRLRLALEPECLDEPTATAREDPRDGADSIRNTQAACGFRYWASKRAPFFQRCKVIAAIFRASVRRAISGWMPLASSAA